MRKVKEYEKVRYIPFGYDENRNDYCDVTVDFNSETGKYHFEFKMKYIGRTCLRSFYCSDYNFGMAHIEEECISFRKLSRRKKC